MTWKSVLEELPSEDNNYEFFLVCCDKQCIGQHAAWAIARFVDGWEMLTRDEDQFPTFTDIWGDFFDKSEITHWMNVPNPWNNK